LETHLPITPVQYLFAAGTPLKSLRANKRGSRRGKPLIYIVDDEVVLLDVAEMALGGGEYQFKKFGDPEEALSSFRKESSPPDLLITDYAMGKMNGLELIERCREIAPGLKTILTSGTAGAEIMHNAATPANEFLKKPFPSTSLAELVQQVLASK
jgi:DNA-binding NtrC family response regulator